MKQEKIEDMIENYGLERILEDNRMSLVELLDIMENLGYLDLEMYCEEEV